jgi:hypothetical protein
MVIFDVDAQGRTTDVSAFDIHGRISLKDTERRDLLTSNSKPVICGNVLVTSQFIWIKP